MAENISASSGHGFLIVMLATVAAIVLVYPLLQSIAKMFGISI
jgi:hypothetical protein